jgi:hypothetical protein
MEEDVAFDFRTDKVYPDPEQDSLMRKLDKRVNFGGRL